MYCMGDQTKVKVQKEVQVHWSLKRQNVFIGGITMKVVVVVVVVAAVAAALGQLHINSMDIEKMRMLGLEFIYRMNRNANIGITIKNCLIFLDFQETQLKDKTLSHEIPGRLWEFVGADIFSINNKNCICIGDYHSKCPVIKQLECLSTNNLMKAPRLFLEYSLLSKTVSDAGTNCVPEKFEDFFRHLDIYHALLPSYNHQSNDLTETRIKFVRRTENKKCYENDYICMALLQTRLTLISPGLPSTALPEA